MLALLLIVGLGGLARLWGNGFGLPYLFHPDEGYVVMPAVRILRTGDLNPGWFDYGSLFIYVLYLSYIPYFLFGASRGVFQVVQDIPYYERFREVGAYDFPSLFVVSRSVSAFFGTALVVVVYLLAKRMLGRRVAVLAGLFLAVFPPLVRSAHYATTDTPMMFFVTLSILLAVHLYEDGAWKHYILTGFVAGLAISTKYSAFPVVAALVAAHLLRGGHIHTVLGARIWCAVGAVGVGFLVGSPFVPVEMPNFLNMLAKQIRVYGRPGGEPPLEPTVLWWLKYMLTGEIWPLTVLALAGIGHMVLRKPKEAVLLISAPLIFWGVMLMQTLRYPRSWLPTAPILVPLAAYGLVCTSESLTQRLMRIRMRGAALLSVLGVVLTVGWGSVAVQDDWRMTQADVRVAALRWIEEHLPADSRVAIDLAGPPLTDPPWNVARYISLGDYPLSYYLAQEYDYLVVSQRSQQNPNLTRANVTNFGSVTSGAELIADLSGVCVHQPDCHLWVYQMPRD